MNDAYCAVAYAPPDMANSGTYSNVLYSLVNTALPLPPAVGP